MSIRLDLLRHGVTRDHSGFRGRLDDPLTATGWQQMQTSIQCQERLWQVVLSSPLQRCAAFAQWISSDCGLPLHCDERWQELDFGQWEGRNALDLMKMDAPALERFWRDPWSNPPPGGETLAHFGARIAQGVSALRDYEAQRMLLVTHGGVIRWLLMRARAWPRQRLLDIEVPHGALFSIRIDANGGMTEEAAR